ncbi:MAG: HEAT repeat domain-containing protein [Spirochaetes bacterium]|nr:HEAT repeat domain-containing protein [Spirochaetota bacterium]
MKSPSLKIIHAWIILLSAFFISDSFPEQLAPDVIISRLLSGDSGTVNNTYVYISRTKPGELIQPLSDFLLSGERAARKSIIIKALKYYPFEKSVPACLDILKRSPSFLVKKELIDYLATSNDKRIVLPVVEELTSPFSAVRESAILALRAVGDDRMYPFMLRMMESDNPIYRVYALEALYYLYDIRFYDLLIKMLSDENRSIRYYVLKCIEKNRLKESLVHVRRIAQNDQSWENRVKAIRILGVLNDDSSLYVLLKCLAEENREIRLTAAGSLFLLKFKNSAYSLSEQLAAECDDEIKKIIIDTLIELNNAGGYRGLRKVLSGDKNSDIRILSAVALGSIRFKDSINILIGALNDPDPKVRAEICNSLGYYSTKESVQSLIDALNDDQDRYVRTAALYSIKRMGLKYVVTPLFDRYVIEDDPIVKEKLRMTVRSFLR